MSLEKIEAVHKLLAQGMTMRAVAEQVGVSLGAVHKISKDHDAATEEFEERAGIMEYDGELPRDEAERQALLSL